MLLTPSPYHKLSHLLGLPPPSSVTYFMDGPLPTHMVLCVRANRFMLCSALSQKPAQGVIVESVFSHMPCYIHSLRLVLAGLAAG